MRPKSVCLVAVLSLGMALAAPLSAAETPKKKAAAAGKKTENVLDNAAITGKVKSALLADKVAPGMAINVNTNNHVVTLKGQVDNAGQKARAEQVAKKVQGVKKVVNQLTVKQQGSKPRSTSQNAKSPKK